MDSCRKWTGVGSFIPGQVEPLGLEFDMYALMSLSCLTVLYFSEDVTPKLETS